MTAGTTWQPSDQVYTQDHLEICALFYPNSIYYHCLTSSQWAYTIPISLLSFTLSLRQTLPPAPLPAPGESSSFLAASAAAAADFSAAEAATEAITGQDELEARNTEAQKKVIKHLQTRMPALFSETRTGATLLVVCRLENKRSTWRRDSQPLKFRLTVAAEWPRHRFVTVCGLRAQAGAPVAMTASQIKASLTLELLATKLEWRLRAAKGRFPTGIRVLVIGKCAICWY